MKKIDIPVVYLAMLPIYINEYGDGTEIICVDGKKKLLMNSIKSCLKETLKIYAVDIIALRNKYGKSLGIKNNIPIPLTNNFTLIQLKVRKPKVEKDTAYGYIYYEKINRVIESDNGLFCTINLNGIDLKIYQKKLSVEKHMRNASMMKTFFNTIKFDENLKDHENKYSKIYDQPATKGDIAMIYEEIIKMNYKIDKHIT